MILGDKIQFQAELWRWPGETAWHFVNVPKKESAEIKQKMAGKLRGFGSVRVEAVLGMSKWKTSIFPDKKSGTYLLPVKASVRKAEGIFDKDIIKIELKLL